MSASGLPEVSCSACDAVCCRLTVVVMPDDPVPRHLVERTPEGLDVMARGEDGWCVAVDPIRMCCTVYEQRPAICRKFAMGSPYCRSEREAYARRYDDVGDHGDAAPSPIPLRLR
jgi:Fe-S-cluster containining protein